MLPHVVDAEYVKDYIVKMRFDDGNVKMADLETYTKRGGVFQKLRDKEFFKMFFIDLNTLCWPNGVDIAPDKLYEIGVSIDQKCEVA